MDFTQVTEPNQIQAAFRMLRKVLTTDSRLSRRTVGFQSGNATRTVHWHPKYGFWAIVDANPAESRFWTAFGTQDPSEQSKRASLTITCEANVPKYGIDRRCGGAFYKRGRATYLCHTGRVGGGGKGIGKSAFTSWYAERFGITWPRGIVVGTLSGTRSGFLSETARFIQAVGQFKTEVKTKGAVIEELEIDADMAQDEGDFAPRGSEKDRERTLRSINIRRGQPEFRKKLLRAYSGKCAFCGYDCVDALEAAHLRAYWNEDSNHVQNGLLLRGDLHTLFDLGRIGVDPGNFTIVVSRQLLSTRYGKLHGTKVRLSANRSQWPNAEILRDHLARWKLL